MGTDTLTIKASPLLYNLLYETAKLVIDTTIYTIAYTYTIADLCIITSTRTHDLIHTDNVEAKI